MGESTYLAAGEADGDDAELVAFGEEFGGDGGWGGHGYGWRAGESEGEG